MKYELRLIHQVPNTPDAAVSVKFIKDLMQSDHDASLVPKTTLEDWDGAVGVYTGAWPDDRGRAVRLSVDPKDRRQAWFAEEKGESDNTIRVHHVFFDGYLAKGVSLEFSFEEDQHGSSRIFKVNGLRRL